MTTNVPGPSSRSTAWAGRCSVPALRAHLPRRAGGHHDPPYNGRLSFGITGDRDTAPTSTCSCPGHRRRRGPPALGGGDLRPLGRDRPARTMGRGLARPGGSARPGVGLPRGGLRWAAGPDARGCGGRGPTRGANDSGVTVRPPQMMVPERFPVVGAGRSGRGSTRRRSARRPRRARRAERVAALMEAHGGGGHHRRLRAPDEFEARLRGDAPPPRLGGRHRRHPGGGRRPRHRRLPRAAHLQRRVAGRRRRDAVDLGGRPAAGASPPATSASTPTSSTRRPASPTSPVPDRRWRGAATRARPRGARRGGGPPPLAALLLDGLARWARPRSGHPARAPPPGRARRSSPSHTVAAGLGASPGRRAPVSSRMRRRLRHWPGPTSATPARRSPPSSRDRRRSAVHAPRHDLAAERPCWRHPPPGCGVPILSACRPLVALLVSTTPRRRRGGPSLPFSRGGSPVSWAPALTHPPAPPTGDHPSGACPMRHLSDGPDQRGLLLRDILGAGSGRRRRRPQTAGPVRTPHVPSGAVRRRQPNGSPPPSQLRQRSVDRVNLIIGLCFAGLALFGGYWLEPQPGERHRHRCRAGRHHHAATGGRPADRGGGVTDHPPGLGRADLRRRGRHRRLQRRTTTTGSCGPRRPARASGTASTTSPRREEGDPSGDLWDLTFEVAPPPPGQTERG